MPFFSGDTAHVSSAVQVASDFREKNSGRIRPVQDDLPGSSSGKKSVRPGCVYAQELAATLFPDQAILGEWSGLVSSSCSKYGTEWVCDAMRTAAMSMESQRRPRSSLTWRYIESILMAWKERGYSREEYIEDKNRCRSKEEEKKKAKDFLSNSITCPKKSIESLQERNIRDRIVSLLDEKKRANLNEIYDSVAAIEKDIESGADPISDIASRVFKRDK